METKKPWHHVKTIEMPKKLQNFLLDSCKSHLDKLNYEYKNELIEDSTQKESFQVLGEFMSLDNKLYITVRATKNKITYPKDSKVVPSGVSQNALPDSSTT